MSASKDHRIGSFDRLLRDTPALIMAIDLYHDRAYSLIKSQGRYHLVRDHTG